jgi:hypothetical protein
MRLLTLFTLWILPALLLSQAESEIVRTIDWNAQASKHFKSDGNALEYWQFRGCIFQNEAPLVPVWSERFPLSGRAEVSAILQNINTETLAWTAPEGVTVATDFQVVARLEQERSSYFLRVNIVPIRKTNAGFERLTTFTLRLKNTPLPLQTEDRGGPFKNVSALKDGAVYKFGVAQNGIYKLDYNFLKNDLKISDLDNIDPRNIHLLGNGGAMLPERNRDARADDLTENAIFISGEGDGKFNTGDYILFYAVGPQPVAFRTSTTDPQVVTPVHLYDRNAWYFIKIDGTSGVRVGEQASVPASFVTEEFDDHRRIEEEKTNLLDFAETSQGSGKQWFGDYFFQTRSRDYKFTFPNIVTNTPGRFRLEFAARSSNSTGIRLSAPGVQPFIRNLSGVNVSDNESSFASETAVVGTFQPSGDDVSFKLEYPTTPQQSEGWLDFIQVNARRRLIMTGSSMEFQDISTLSQPAATFKMSGINGNITIWDITEPLTPRNQAKTVNGAAVEFGATTQNTLRRFIAFYENNAFPKPEQAQGKIANQNLHGLTTADMVIVYHPEMEAQAKSLADHRRTFSKLEVVPVNIIDIFNEFSSGAKDPVAIRDFARMMLERNPVRFKYLLLFGDGSFDPKNNSNGVENKDFIPVFETVESFNPVLAFPSDDFFGLLSPDETGDLVGALDIAVGRFTARSPAEAQSIINKIVSYESKPESLGDWRLRSLYIADDEDGNPHIDQADKLANEQLQDEKWFNIEKIYFDAYQQIATSGGQRYPDVKSAINANVFKGALVVQYIGHGGPRGWAQERVIDQNDIAGWDNPGRYPLIITATCSFGGYDDYTTLTGGEQSLIKTNSGAIGLFTTVRAVYISGNEQLTDAVQRLLFRRLEGSYRSIGEVLYRAKNTLGGSNDNARRFTLLGDPAMYLDLPDHRVQTISVKNARGQAIDTLKALMSVEIEGMVTDTAGNRLERFNGRVMVSLFDKPQTLQTLGQDPDSRVRTFEVQRNNIFRGSATVTNGLFKISLIVPKDIDYKYGLGKISYYAEDGSPFDAAGADCTKIIGGNAGEIKDEEPPIVQPFLNTDAFAFGGLTDTDPKILVKCTDDYGMNVSGASLGHDLTAILDGNVLETIVLNDFYQSETNNFRKGSAIYPMRNLAPGRHTLQVKGWDIANNSGEGYTEFVVAENGQSALQHVLNYPNPFTTNTYFQFEHTLAGQNLDVQVHIFTVSGKLVKTIQQSLSSDSYRISDEIAWDGRDEYGDALARGVYVYRVKVRGTDIAGQTTTVESDFEKLVILK